MKAADIDDAAFLAAMERVMHLRSEEWGTPATMASRWDIAEELGEVPEKVVLAKAKRLIGRGLIDGCTCGCRGDFVLVRQSHLSAQ